jgi:hypothetical protein
MTLGEQLRAKFEEAAKKEALQATLTEWDNDEQKQIKGETMSTTTTPKTAYLFQPTNNASRDTFNFIRDNPGLRISEIKAGLPNHKSNTVGSLTYQMVVAGLLRKDENNCTFHAIKPEFEPFSINKLRRERKKAAEPRKLVIVKRRTAQEAEAAHNANVAGTGVDTNAGISAGLGALTSSVELTSRPRPWRPEDTVDTLTLLQAKAVHAYLQQLFGAL